MTLSEAVKILEDAGVPSPDYDARELFRFAEGLPFGALIQKSFSSDKADTIIERRRRREPLGYIIGEVGFFKEVYEVTPDVLIPRPDTEILVEYAVKHIPKGESFLDLCTGSGCIAVSTLANTADTTAVAVDISEGALSVAKRNALRAGVKNRISFIQADLMSKELPDGEFFAVLSNPPYVTDGEYKALEPEIYEEPRSAFIGGADGLDFYKRLLPLSLERLKTGGFIAFEIGAYQAHALLELAGEFSLDCEILRDYSGMDRVAVIRRK